MLLTAAAICHAPCPRSIRARRQLAPLRGRPRRRSGVARHVTNPAVRTVRVVHFNLAVLRDAAVAATSSEREDAAGEAHEGVHQRPSGSDAGSKDADVSLHPEGLVC